MITCMFCFFPLQVLDKLDFEVLDFGIFSELAILNWYSTRRIKHARTQVCTYFNWNIYHIFCIVISLFFWLILYRKYFHKRNDTTNFWMK